MGHHHDHDHEHDHDHGHEHGHDHGEGHHTHSHPIKDLTFEIKAGKLLRHWIQHNADHAASYRQWAAEFRQHGLVDAASLLESAADLTLHINQTIDQAAMLVPQASAE